jgi:predicted TIM-barrel fold metal-dependent hydrolase
VGSFIYAARKAYGVLAVKIHPNLAGLDPLASRGRESIEAALAAAGNLGLPVIVHAGRTPGIEPMESGDYAALSRLAEINWGVSSAPVIIAHAGCYGLEEGAAKAQAPILERLFRRHSNLLADTSALPLQALCHILSMLDRNRLVFGSDALYQPIWKAWLVFLGALRQISSSPDDDLVRIASVNPARCLAAALTQDSKSLI